MKKCNKCKETKDLSNFYTNKGGKLGVRARCKFCERKLDIKRNKTQKRKDYKKKYYNEVWKDIELERNKQKYKNNTEYRFRVKKHQKKYYRKNKHRYREAWAKYKAQKLNATLEGYSEEIRKIYKNCPKGYHVDHIIPLQGKSLCGLHVPWNLQYLTAEENLKKSNKVLKGIYNDQKRTPRPH